MPVGRGFPVVIPARRTTLGACHPTYLYRLGVNTEIIFAAIHLIGDSLTDEFAERRRKLTPVVVLPPGYEVRHFVFVFLQSGKQQGLAVYSDRFGCHAQIDHLKVGKPGGSTRTGHIPLFID